jgi:hypothetical protein
MPAFNKQQPPVQIDDLFGCRAGVSSQIAGNGHDGIADDADVCGAAVGQQCSSQQQTTGHAKRVM